MASRYCPFFCEENIWHLCTDPLVIRNGAPVPVEERQVIVLSSPGSRVAMRLQRAGGRRGVLWDYHVALVADGKVWDLDTTLGVPVDLETWLSGSFYPLLPDYAPKFRVIDAPTYLSRFESDRSHMLGPDGLPLKPFPTWPRIGSGMTLPNFVDMETPFVGQVFDLDSFRRNYAVP